MSDTKTEDWQGSRWEFTKNRSRWHFDTTKPPDQGIDSYTHVCRFNTDFSNALNQIRIEHAIELLNKTPLAVSEIANLCGFKSSTHFIRVFKKLNGTTPIAFRSRAHDMGTIQAYEKSKEAKPFPWKISLPSN